MLRPRVAVMHLIAVVGVWWQTDSRKVLRRARAFELETDTGFRG